MALSQLRMHHAHHMTAWTERSITNFVLSGKNGNTVTRYQAEKLFQYAKFMLGRLHHGSLFLPDKKVPEADHFVNCPLRYGMTVSYLNTFTHLSSKPSIRM